MLVLPFLGCLSFETRTRLKSDSHLPKKLLYLLQWKPFKNDEKCFLFHVKVPFVPEIFEFLSWLFGHLEKPTWLERQG